MEYNGIACRDVGEIGPGSGVEDMNVKSDRKQVGGAGHGIDAAECRRVLPNTADPADRSRTPSNYAERHAVLL